MNADEGLSTAITHRLGDHQAALWLVLRLSSGRSSRTTHDLQRTEAPAPSTNHTSEELHRKRVETGEWEWIDLFPKATERPLHDCSVDQEREEMRERCNIPYQNAHHEKEVCLFPQTHPTALMITLQCPKESSNPPAPPRYVYPISLVWPPSERIRVKIYCSSHRTPPGDTNRNRTSCIPAESAIQACAIESASLLCAGAPTRLGTWRFSTGDVCDVGDHVVMVLVLHDHGCTQSYVNSEPRVAHE